MTKFGRVVLLEITISLTHIISPAVSDDYPVLEKALKEASIEVNKLNMPGLIYKLDEKTAEQYFEKYFSQNYLNHALRVNISYPVFSWGNNHENLQKALSNVLMTHLQKFFAEHCSPSSINTAIKADNRMHGHIFDILAFLVDISNSKNLDQKYKLDLLERLISIMKISGLGEQRYARINKEECPFVNSIKAQFFMTLFSLAKQSNEIKLLSTSISLLGERKGLLDIYNVLILDNCGFDNTQLQGIKSFVRGTPKHIRVPVVIMCYDYLISPENKLVTVHSFQCNGAFNIFGSKLGAWSENQFPKDYKMVEADGFMIVLAHEYNHNVDAIYVEGTEALKTFKQRLLKKAGANHNNYLRSTFEDGFFKKNPQEFVASMANQYFCSSEDMFLYALKRAKEGNLNQINQFIFMASIYSNGDTTRFYKIDKSGQVKASAVPLKKENGLVTDILLGKNEYNFHYTDGIIDKISSSEFKNRSAIRLRSCLLTTAK